jgi:hypothetical protein
MKSRTTRRFREMFALLPPRVQRQAREAYRLFARDPAHPSLRFKRVHNEPPTYSARVGIGYRAVAALDGETAVSFWIGSHADYDRLLSQL